MATKQRKEQLLQRDGSTIPFLLPIHTFSSSTISAIPLTPQTPLPLPLFEKPTALVHDAFNHTNSSQETLQTWDSIKNLFGTSQQDLSPQSEQLSTLRQQLQLQAEPRHQQPSFGGSVSLHHQSNQPQVHQSSGQDISFLRFPDLQGVNDATSRVLCVLSHLCPLPPPPHPPYSVGSLDSVTAATTSQSTLQKLPCLHQPSSEAMSPLSSNNYKDVFTRTRTVSSPLPPLSPIQSHLPPGPSTDRNRRRRLTVDETEYLLDQFHKNEKPNTKERLVFAAHLNLHSRTVQVWFQNRRAKLKRDVSLARALYGDGEQDFEDEEMEEKEEMENENEEKEGKDKQGDSGGSVRNEIDDDLELAMHRGSGTQTFVGFERSDAGFVDLILDTELQRFPTPENADTNMFSSALLNSARGIDGYCDLATLDLGFGLTYETMLGLPAHDNRPSLQFDTDMRIQRTWHDVEDDDRILSLIPSLIGSNSGSGTGSPSRSRDSPSSSTDAVIPTSERQNQREPKSDGKNVVSQTNCTWTLSSQHPNRSVNRPDRRSSSLRKSPFLLRRHNPIPRHQLALTLIPTTPCTSSLHK